MNAYILRGDIINQASNYLHLVPHHTNRLPLLYHMHVESVLWPFVRNHVSIQKSIANWKCDIPIVDVQRDAHYVILINFDPAFKWSSSALLIAHWNNFTIEV